MRISKETALKLLQDGNVVGIPTETVYGLGASLFHLKAIKKVFELKGRPLNNPLIVHIASLEDLTNFKPEYPPGFHSLARAFWPGPLTIVLPIDQTTIPNEVRANLSTIAVRMPNHEAALELIKQSGPLVMPSANLSGRPSATKPEHVEMDFGSDFPVLDGGECRKGLESTILHYTGEAFEIIRQGALPCAAFEKVLGYQPQIAIVKNENKPICPGQLYRHYAPKAKLYLRHSFENDCRGIILGFKGRSYPPQCKVICLGDLNIPESIAEKLYDSLREIDIIGIESAFVDMDFPSTGLLSTIKERLQKASLK